MSTPKKVVKPAPAEVTEKVTKAVPAKDAAPKEKKERKIGTRKFKDDQIVTLLVDYNPKRKGSASHGRFENYEDGMTVTEALKAGLTSGDLSWDVEHEHIQIGDTFDDDAVVKSKPESKPKTEKVAKPKKAKKEEVEEEEEEEEEEEA
jgi:outer membrane protein assembly factor BamE (lipoprotein component of BamABCDE complex)